MAKFSVTQKNMVDHPHPCSCKVTAVKTNRRNRCLHEFSLFVAENGQR